MDQFLFLFVIALCGTRISCLKAEGANRILEGTPATVNQFPYMVSLQNTNEIQNYQRGHRCGGALVTLQHAVTAASCNFDEVNGVFMAINPEQHRVFSGAVTLTGDASTDHSRGIEIITVHPQYFTSNPFVNNIAVIFLNSAFSSATITPVPLSISDSTDTDPNPCFVSGWGAQNGTAAASVQLMQVPQQVSEQGACRAHYSGQLSLVDSMICARGFQQTPFSGCTGDLGNPLVCSGNLNGILIFHKNCSVSAEPEVYTRISSFSAWIDRTTGVSSAPTFQPGMVVLSVIAIAQIITANIIN